MNSARDEDDSPAPTRPSTGWVWLSAAWAVALVSTFAALFIGEVMGMTPFQLRWYQRILMFPLAVILGMAAFGNDRRGAVYALQLACRSDDGEDRAVAVVESVSAPKRQPRPCGLATRGE